VVAYATVPLHDASSGETLIARDYLRVSKRDRSGRERSPDEQHEDNLRHAGDHDWTLGESYRDVGSASRYARKGRDDFSRLLTDLQADRFAADVLILWESSRGSRRVSEWVELIELCVERGVRIYVTTHSRIYNPANTRDRRSLLEDAVDSEYEAGKTSDRLQRSHAARAAEGKAVGRLSYGYKRVYDDGKLIGRAPDTTAQHVRELFDRFASGVSMRAIALDWQARGIVNGQGRPFTGPQLRDMLRNRVYIGERVHMPGQISRWWRAPELAEITPGQWEPVVDREVFFAVQAILNDPARVTTRPGGAKHLLSMFTVCDTCDGPMCVLTQRGRSVYRCRAKGCAQVYKDELEEFALVAIEHYLSSPDIYRQPEGDGSAVELQQARAELAELRAHYRELRASFRARRISIAAFEEAEPGTLSDIEAVAERVRLLETPPVLRGLLQPGADVRQHLRGTDDPARRLIAQYVLTPDRAGQLRVLPSPSRGHHVPIHRRVHLRQN
jgi:site-specific DNA recombinase